MNLSIVTPAKNPPKIDEFILLNKQLLGEAKQFIVIDSGGACKLREYATTYKRLDIPLWKARQMGYHAVTQPVTMNLDVDVVAPVEYVLGALDLLKDNLADAVSIFYEDAGHCQGALEFGVSIWRTELLRSLYDFSFALVSDGKIARIGPHIFSSLNNGWCECTYMFRKLKQSGGKLETLPFRASHLKGDVR